MPLLRSTFAAIACILAFLCGCSTPGKNSARLAPGFWVTCSEKEATHAVTLDYAVHDSLRSRAIWYIKSVKTAGKEPAPLETTSQSVELIRSGKKVRDKCEAAFFLVAPNGRFPTAPFLISVSLKWQADGATGEFSQVLEVRDTLVTNLPEKNLKLNVSITDIRTR